MPNKSINGVIQIKNGLSSAWKTVNPILAKGEMGIELDTRKFKFGDGVTTWNSLDYASAGQSFITTINPTASNYSFDIGTLWINTTTDRAFVMLDNSPEAAVWGNVAFLSDIESAGFGDMLKSLFATQKPAQGYVDKSITAEKLERKFTLALTGDIIGSVQVDGSETVSINAALQSIATQGTYTKVTINSKGQVTSGGSLEASDIPALDSSKISNLGTAAKANIGTSAGNIVALDSNGKLPESVVPAIAIVDTYVVGSESEMLALTAQKGDIAIRTDIEKTYILTTNDPTLIENWKELATPGDAVKSVNGKIGVVELSTSDVKEGTNQYFTNSRFDERYTQKIAETSVESLINGKNVLMSTDTLIFDGGEITSE